MGPTRRDRAERQPRPEQIAELLRRAIRAGLLEPGQSLAQEDLAARFGASRGPLREALRVLAGEGLVTIVPGYGASSPRSTPTRSPSCTTSAQGWRPGWPPRS